ncbi:hypothetical protein OAG52_01665, partial [Verrucomicrobia bacterium]|nr:hypothetical protein [Verrucomicrobiota bacterium]
PLFLWGGGRRLIQFLPHSRWIPEGLDSVGDAPVLTAFTYRDVFIAIPRLGELKFRLGWLRVGIF